MITIQRRSRRICWSLFLSFLIALLAQRLLCFGPCLGREPELVSIRARQRGCNRQSVSCRLYGRFAGISIAPWKGLNRNCVCEFVSL
jgi:hypothetical protein